MTIATVAVVGLGSIITGNPVQADTVNSLKNNQTQIANERSAVKEKLSKADAEIADVLFDLKEINEEIARVDNALKENKNMLKDAKNDIKKSEKEIEVLEEEIIQLEETIEKRFEILKDRVTSYQKTGGSIGFLEVLFGAKNFSDFISRAAVVTKITNSDTELMNQQEEDKAQVVEKQEEVAKKLAKQKELKVELEGMEMLISEQQEANKESKDKLSEKEKTLTTLKEDLTNKDSSLASLEAQIRRDISAARTTTGPIANNNGGNNLVTLGSQTQNNYGASSGNGRIDIAVNAGYKHIGTPYTWGGKGPGGFDCSGFVSWAYREAGFSIPSTTDALSGTGTKVSYANIQPGDLVFFDTYKKNGHVGIYVGGGKFIGSQNSTGLAVADMSSGFWKSKFNGLVRRVN